MEGGERYSVGAKIKYPLGFRFKPTDEVLVEFYLLPRLQGKPTVPNDAIIEANVYECDPEILINQRYKDRGEKRWHFLSPRTRKYQKGDRPSRRTADNRGRWKPSTGKSKKKQEGEGEEEDEEHDEEDEDDENEDEEENEEPEEETKLCGNGAIKFCVTTLAYHVGPPTNEKKTKWLMRELTVPEYEIKVDSSVPGGCTTVLDRYAMCSVYMSPLKKWYKDKKGGASTAREETAGPAPESGQGNAAPTTLSKRQQWQVGRATATKRARQPTRVPGGPPTPTRNNNGGGATGVLPLGGGPNVVPAGQQTSIVPWQPVTRNGRQGPVQLPLPPMYTHNGWPVAPVEGLAGSSLRPPVSAHDSSLDRANMVTCPPPPASFFGDKMVMRPQYGLDLAARQTFPPPPPPDPQPQWQPLEVDMDDPNTQRAVSRLIAEMKAPKSASSSDRDAAQQQGPAAWSLPPPPQQQQEPTFSAGADTHPARANATVPHPGDGGQRHQQQQQERSSSLPVTNMSVPGGAAAPASYHASSKLPVRRYMQMEKATPSNILQGWPL